MTVQNFAFTKLVVGNLESMSAFYEAVCGLKRQATVDAEIGGRKITEIIYAPTARGGGNFILLAYHDTPAPAASEVIIGFIADDVSAFVARALAAGGKVYQQARDATEHGLTVGFITDPEGHLIEVIKPL